MILLLADQSGMGFPEAIVWVAGLAVLGMFCYLAFKSFESRSY